MTATRREESLSKVPISVTALTQENLDLARHQGLLGRRALHPGCSVRQLGHQQHLDPRHLRHRRRRHHRHLHRRHADPDARARLQSRRGAAQVLRHRARRGAARSAGHAVRLRLRGRHGALHHHAAEPDQDHASTAAREVVDHPGWRARATRPASPSAARSCRARSARASRSGTAATAAGSIDINPYTCRRSTTATPTTTRPCWCGWRACGRPTTSGHSLRASTIRAASGTTSPTTGRSLRPQRQPLRQLRPEPARSARQVLPAGAQDRG